LPPFLSAVTKEKHDPDSQKGPHLLLLQNTLGIQDGLHLVFGLLWIWQRAKFSQFLLCFVTRGKGLKMI
jgi:hypothetical protein